MSKASWISVQRQLKKRGFDPGPADGIAGTNTIKAVKAFQTASGLNPDGVVGRKTREVLFGAAGAVDYSIMTNAKLAELSYSLVPKPKTFRDKSGDRILDRDFGLTVIRRCEVPGVEAYMLSNGCLLIPGSNSLSDYVRFNLRVIRAGAAQLKLSFNKVGIKEVFSSAAQAGASRTIWHQGFLAHANFIYNWIGADQSQWPRLIVGHSLGAASAQILSKTFVSAAIGFAAPRLRKTNGRVQHDNLSLSVCRDDDVVCRLPLGFHHTGQTRRLVHKKPNDGLNHNMEDYIDALENKGSRSNVPGIWNP